ncbi:DMT family transporter [Candidatus Parcubacteria bacterium]|jgi:drug/metabolite transporter (DMT)-like permease|nr:MAG: DMT family transporter [Candidatus Parcubacteria bacterium]
MEQIAGLLAAFIALIAWGFGDFAIQRSVRLIGAVPALFFIGSLGCLALLPFAWQDISVFLKNNILFFLALTAIVTLIYAVLLFESLGRGKLSVIEPVMSFELPATIAIGVLILKEVVNLQQFIFTAIIFAGLVITVIRREPRHWWQFFRRKSVLEHGVFLAIFAVIVSATVNIMTGILSQQTSPLFAIWGIHTIVAFLCVGWMLIQKEVKETFKIAKTHWRPILAQSLFDNIAWLGFGAAVTVLPISITVAITESYIALAALLGIIVNKEKLQRHQYFGICITLIAAIALATISKNT